MYKLLIFSFILLKYAESDIYVTDSRLSKNYKPSHYELMLIPNITTKTFYGKLNITFKAATNVSQEELKILELNVDKIDIKEYQSYLVKGQDIITITSIAQYEQYEKILIIPGKPFETNQEYVLCTEFTGNLLSTEDNGGLILSSYKNSDGTENNYIVANFFPVYARRAFPCFDEPTFKATFNLTLGIPDGYQGLTNAPLSYTRDGKSSSGAPIKWQVFDQSDIIATSSFGLLISNLISVKNSSTEINVWAPTKELAESIAIESYWSGIKWLAESISFASYKLPILNFVFIPGLFKQSFESFSIIYIRADTVIYNLEGGEKFLPNTKNLIKLQINTAKEVASQYYGDIVTPEWWDEVWLKNGISEYLGTFIANRLQHDDSNDFRQYMGGYLRPLVLDDQRKKGDSIIEPTSDKNSTLMLKGITRQKSKKGAAILFMLRNGFSEEIFEPALRTYLEERSNSTAVTNDLIKAWEMELLRKNETLPNNITVEAIVNSWLKNKRTPVIKVQRTDGTDPNLQTLTISQERVKSNSSWYIPITFTNKQSMNFLRTKAQYWLGHYVDGNQTDDTLTLENAVKKGDWVIFNIQGTGLYRVLYEDADWNLISQQLHENLTIINEINRAQLIDDVFSFAWDSKVKYTTAFKIADYLTLETKFYPWFSAFNSFKKLNQILSKQNIYGDIQGQISHLVESIYNKIGFYEKENDGFKEISLRAETLKWACSLKIGDCLKNATNVLKDILSNNLTSTIQNDYLEAIFCGGIANTDDQNSTWTKVYELYKQKRDSTNEKYLLYALGCSNNSQLIDGLANWIITPDELTNEEAQIIFHTLARKPEHVDVALSLLSNHAYTIENLYGEKTLSSMVLSIGDCLTTEYQYNQLSSLVSQNISENSLSALNMALEKVSSSIIWLETNLRELQNFFNKDVTDEPTEHPVTDVPTNSTTVKPAPGSSTFTTSSILLILISLLLSAFIKF